jgi:hypothetical protein
LPLVRDQTPSQIFFYQFKNQIKMGEFKCKLQSKKTSREVEFLIRYTDKAETTKLLQVGNLRQGSARKAFDTKAELVKSLMKLLTNESVFVRSVESTNGTLFDFLYKGMRVGRNEMYLITREFIGDNTAIQLVNVIDRDQN